MTNTANAALSPALSFPVSLALLNLSGGVGSRFSDVPPAVVDALLDLGWAEVTWARRSREAVLTLTASGLEARSAVLVAAAGAAADWSARLPL